MEHSIHQFTIHRVTTDSNLYTFHLRRQLNRTKVLVLRVIECHATLLFVAVSTLLGGTPTMVCALTLRVCDAARVWVPDPVGALRAAVWEPVFDFVALRGLVRARTRPWVAAVD